MYIIGGSIYYDVPKPNKKTKPNNNDQKFYYLNDINTFYSQLRGTTMKDLYKSLLEMRYAVEPVLKGTEWQVQVKIKEDDQHPHIYFRVLKSSYEHWSANVYQHDYKDERSVEIMCFFLMSQAISTAMASVYAEKNKEV